MSYRQQQVVSQIERVLGEIFIQQGKTWGINLISINDIVISSDLSRAKIWVSFIGEKNQPAAFKNLQNKAKQIQSLFYKKIILRQVPKLFWFLDQNPDKDCRIEGILDDIKKTQTKDSGIQEPDS